MTDQKINISTETDKKNSTSTVLNNLIEDKNKKQNPFGFLKKTSVPANSKDKPVQDKVQGDRNQFSANASEKKEILPMVMIGGVLLVMVLYFFLKPGDEKVEIPAERDLIKMSSEQDAKRDVNAVSRENTGEKDSFQKQLEEAEKNKASEQTAIAQAQASVIPAPGGLNGSENGNSNSEEGGLFSGLFGSGKGIENPFSSRLNSSALIVGNSVGIPDIPTGGDDEPEDAPQETTQSQNTRGGNNSGGGSSEKKPPSGSGGGFLGSTPLGQSIKKGISGLPGVSNAGSFAGVNLSAPNLPAAKATRIGNRNFLLTKGVKIDCVIENEIDTTIPGMLTCIVAHSVYNETGRIILIDRGSQVIGQFSGGASLNQPKVAITWNRLKTPKGIVVDLDSPTTNRLGISGFDGTVDKRFFDRFGSSVMFSLLEIAPSLLGIGGDAGNVIVGAASQQIKGAAQIALENTIGIQPVIRAMQGSVIKIFMGRDLDFSDVYDIATTDKNKKYFK